MAAAFILCCEIHVHNYFTLSFGVCRAPVQGEFDIIQKPCGTLGNYYTCFTIHCWGY